MSKKLHVKELRRDEVVEAVTHAAEGTFQFSQQHRSGLLYGGLGLLAVVIIGILVAWRIDASRRASLSAFGEASRAWAEAAGERTLPEGKTAPTWDEVAASYATVASEHGSSKAGKLATLHQGLALLRANKPAEAAAALDAFVTANPSHWAAPEALAALAAAREDQGDAAAAEAALTKLRDGKWRSWPDGAAQMLLAQFYERQGRREDARTIYQTLSENEKLSETTWGGQAEMRLQELGDAPGAG